MSTLRDEAGQSLVLALVLTAVMAISIAAVIDYTTSNERSFGRDNQSSRALTLAEAGLSNAVSQIVQTDSDDSQSSLTGVSGAHPDGSNGGTVTYTLSKSSEVVDGSSTDVWTIKSTGTYGGVSREVTQDIYYKPGVDIDESQIYNYGLFVGTPPAGQNPSCLITLHGDVNVNANVWIGGNLCTKGNVNLSPIVPPDAGCATDPTDKTCLNLYVAGYVNANGNPSFGTKTDPFWIADIVGGCSSSTYVICSSKTNVYADNYEDTPSTLEKPDVDAASTYAEATAWQGTCTGGFVLDNNGSLDQSVTTTQELFPSTSYTCTVPMTDGTTSTLAWNASTSTLTVLGTVFIDGNISMNNGATWVGAGSIYVNGTVSWTSNHTVCGPALATSAATGFGCPKTWNSQTQTLTGTLTTGSTTVTGLWSTPPSRTGTTTKKSATVTNLSATSDLTTGMGVSGTNIPANTTIASIVSGTSITLSQNSTCGSSSPGCSSTLSFTQSSVPVSVGQVVTGAGIPDGTLVTAVNTAAGTATLSAKATASGAESLSFQADVGLVILNPTDQAAAFSSTGNGELDMEMYTVQGFDNTGGTVVAGSVVTDGGDIGGSTGVLDPTSPPPGFPIYKHTPAIGWTPSPGSWREVKVGS